MQRKLPGIDSPAATEAKIPPWRLLFWSSRATWKGWRGRALTLQHTHAGCMGLKCCIPPTSSRTGTDSELFPPCRSYPVALMTASVAQLMWGGSSSRGLGLWNSRGVVLPDDVAPADAWAYYYQHQDPMDLLLVAAYTKLKVAADVVPQDLYGLQLRCTAGDAGQLGLGELFDQWRSWLRCTRPSRAPAGLP